VTYLDYQASAPLARQALEAMLPWLRDGHANPHSPHREGRRARAAVEVAREDVAALLPAGGQIAFTSGATEALNWAIKGLDGPIVTVATEHAAVLDAVRGSGRPATILPVDAAGLVDLDAAERAIRPGVGLVAVMLVNNEVGVIQPVDRLAAMARAAGAPFLCDAVQGYGRVPLPTEADLIAVSAHKVHGPKGVGALWLRDGVRLRSLIDGGGQEAAGRSGTLSPALCAGFGAAARLMLERADADVAHVEALWDVARDRLPGWTINGAPDRRYRGNLNVRRDGLDVARLMNVERDIAFSAGSACASGSGRSSHVLRAMGLSDAQARSSIRLGFGRYTSADELGDALERLDAAANAQRAFA